MPVLGTFQALREAVQTRTGSAIEVVFDPDAVQLVDRALAEGGTLLLGECHGVAENPAIIRALVDRFAIGTVALEWPAELSGVVDRWAHDGELIDDELLWLGDGRVTAEHLVALRELMRDGVKIALFDRGYSASSSTWSARDHRLAEAALAATETCDRALVVAGNAHTPLTDTRHGTPMGVWIARARPGVQQVAINYGSGRLFNLGEQMLPDRFAAEPTARLCVADGCLELRLPRATAASVACRIDGAAATTAHPTESWPRGTVRGGS